MKCLFEETPLKTYLFACQRAVYAHKLYFSQQKQFL